MAYSKEEIEDKFNLIESKIESGISLRQCLREESLSSQTFYKWLEETNEEGNLTASAIDKSKRYMRACEERADVIFEDIIDIADDKSRDTITTEYGEIPNTEFIQRSRVRIDARKWILSKMNPKKYGDKLDMTTLGEKIQPQELKITIRKPIDEDDE